MNETRKTVVVTGATGQQGGRVARFLLARGHRVRALTRSPTSASATTLATSGAEVLGADLESGEGLSAALRGADAAFLVTTPFERGAGAEIEQAARFGEAARAADVGHVVYSSVTLPMTRTPIAHFAAKGRAEQLLRALEVPLTIVGAPPFFDNVVAPWHLPWLRQGIFALPGSLEMRLQMVAVVDLAAVAATALHEGERWIGERIDVASDELSQREMKEVLEGAFGRPLESRAMTFADLDPKLGELFAMPNEPSGPAAAPVVPTRFEAPPRLDLAALHARFPEVRWHSFAQWVAGQNWSRWLAG